MECKHDGYIVLIVITTAYTAHVVRNNQYDICSSDVDSGNGRVEFECKVCGLSKTYNVHSKRCPKFVLKAWYVVMKGKIV